MTADNYIRELYFDGTQIPMNHGGWGDAWTFVLPANLSVIAVKCEDTEVCTCNRPTDRPTDRPPTDFQRGRVTWLSVVVDSLQPCESNHRTDRCDRHTIETSDVMSYFSETCIYVYMNKRSTRLDSTRLESHRNKANQKRG